MSGGVWLHTRLGNRQRKAVRAPLLWPQLTRMLCWQRPSRCHADLQQHVLAAGGHVKATTSVVDVGGLLCGRVNLHGVDPADLPHAVQTCAAFVAAFVLSPCERTRAAVCWRRRLRLLAPAQQACTAGSVGVQGRCCD